MHRDNPTRTGEGQGDFAMVGMTVPAFVSPCFKEGGPLPVFA